MLLVNRFSRYLRVKLVKKEPLVRLVHLHTIFGKLLETLVLKLISLHLLMERKAKQVNRDLRVIKVK